jgi:hypothetical protein
MKKTWMLLALVALLVPVIAVLAPPADAQNGHLGITICHRTGSDGNSYVAITPDKESIVAAHVYPDPHPPKAGRVDFILDWPNGTKEECAKYDPDPKK